MAAFFHWLFHTSTGVIVLIAACMVIALVMAAVLEKGTRRRYSDRGPVSRPELDLDLEGAAERLREKADNLVDQVDALLDGDDDPDGDLEGDSGLVGALEDLWNSWDGTLDASEDQD